MGKGQYPRRHLVLWPRVQVYSREGEVFPPTSTVSAGETPKAATASETPGRRSTARIQEVQGSGHIAALGPGEGCWEQRRAREGEQPPGKLPLEPTRPLSKHQEFRPQNGIPEVLLRGAKPDTNAGLVFILLRFLDCCPRPVALVQKGNCDRRETA